MWYDNFKSFFYAKKTFHCKVSSSLVTGIKAEAETQDDSDSQKRLLAAAKVLADATAKLVEAAKVSSLYRLSLICNNIWDIHVCPKLHVYFKIVIYIIS